MRSDEAGTEARGLDTRGLTATDGGGPGVGGGGPRSPAERLLELALRNGGKQDGELPWHLAVHLARAEAATEEVGPAAPLGERALVAHALGRALAAALAGAPSDEQAARLVAWMKPLLRVDRQCGADVFGGLYSVLDAEAASEARETVGAALLWMLDELDPAAEPPEIASPLLVRDLALIGAFQLDGSPDGPGGATWPVVVHGVFRYLSATAAAQGPSAVGRWLRLCPSRAALRYVAGLDLVRDDPVLLATLLLHGGPREVAVALAALRNVDPDAPVRAIVVGLVRREPVLTSQRAAWLFDQVGRLPEALPELREALLDRLERGRGEGEAPVTDGLLRPVRRGMVEAALLSGRATPDARRDGLLSGLLGAVDETLSGDDPATAPADPAWLRAMSHAIRECWRAADGLARRDVRKRVMRTLADVEGALHRRLVRAVRAEGEGAVVALSPRFQALAALALQVARALPDGESGASFALALYEAALRLRTARPEALRDHPAFRSLEPLFADAPDPRDPEQVESVGAFLERWRTLDLGSDAALPPAETAPALTGPTLGVARLPGAGAGAREAAGGEPSPRALRALLRRLWH